MLAWFVLDSSHGHSVLGCGSLGTVSVHSYQTIIIAP